MRTAILFTKADLLPWFSLHRPRYAEAWFEKDEGLKSLVKKIRTDCGPGTRFFFSSSIGWHQGGLNCRTALMPRRLVVEDSAEKQEPGDLIPELESARSVTDTKAGKGLGRSMWPLFTDPMQIVDHELVRPGKLQAGLLPMPGRKPPEAGHHNFLTPWNIVEPLLWAAGIPEDEF